MTVFDSAYVHRTRMHSEKRSEHNSLREREKKAAEHYKTLGGLRTGDVVDMGIIGTAVIGRVRHNKHDGTYVVTDQEGRHLNILTIERIVHRTTLKKTQGGT